METDRPAALRVTSSKFVMWTSEESTPLSEPAIDVLKTFCTDVSKALADMPAMVIETLILCSPAMVG